VWVLWAAEGPRDDALLIARCGPQVGIDGMERVGGRAGAGRISAISPQCELKESSCYAWPASAVCGAPTNGVEKRVLFSRPPYSFDGAGLNDIEGSRCKPGWDGGLDSCDTWSEGWGHAYVCLGDGVFG